MKKIFFLIVFFSCTKLNLKNLKSSSKHPISYSLSLAIKEGDDEKIMEQLEQSKNDLANLDNVNLADLREENKNFLMFLLQNYGKSYSHKGNNNNNNNNQGEKDLIKCKKEIFEKCLKYFKDNLVENEFEELMKDSDKDGKTILFYAIDTGIGEIVTSLIDIQHVDLEHLNKDKLSPLNYCILNEKSIFNYLCSKKIQGNAKKSYLKKFEMSKNPNIKGASPLLVACLSNKPDIVKKLLEQGAEVNIENDHDTKAIWLAAINGNKKVVETLLAKGAKHLSRKDIILNKTQTLLGTFMKAFLQKSLDVGIATANIAAKAHGVESGIPFGIDIKAFDNTSSDIDKHEAYKEVRRIYKDGRWISSLEKKDFNVYIILEVIQTFSNIFNKITKKYLELKIIHKTNKNNPDITRKIHSIDKMSSEMLADIGKTKKYLEELIVNLMNLEDFDNEDETLKACLKDFKENLENSLNKYKEEEKLSNRAYIIHNSKKDNSFKKYLKESDTPTFYEMEKLLTDTVNKFQNFVHINNYEAMLKYLHDEFQRRTQVKNDVKKREKETKDDSKRNLETIKSGLKSMFHTEKVSKINAFIQLDNNKNKIARKEFYIEKIIEYSNVNYTAHNNENKIPKLDTSALGDQKSYEEFMQSFKLLLDKRDSLLNFIKDQIQ